MHSFLDLRLWPCSYRKRFAGIAAYIDCSVSKPYLQTARATPSGRWARPRRERTPTRTRAYLSEAGIGGGHTKPQPVTGDSSPTAMYPRAPPLPRETLLPSQSPRASRPTPRSSPRATPPLPPSSPPPWPPYAPTSKSPLGPSPAMSRHQVCPAPPPSFLRETEHPSRRTRTASPALGRMGGGFTSQSIDQTPWPMSR